MEGKESRALKRPDDDKIFVGGGDTIACLINSPRDETLTDTLAISNGIAALLKHDTLGKATTR